jgi:hypothetical protein
MIHGYLNNIGRKHQTIYHNIKDIEITKSGREVSGYNLNLLRDVRDKAERKSLNRFRASSNN